MKQNKSLVKNHKSIKVTIILFFNFFNLHDQIQSIKNLSIISFL